MIQSVERAARILAALGSGGPRLGVTELAERLDLAKPTVHGLLRTLEAHELVYQDPETGKYRLGPALLQLGNAYLDHHELRSRSLLWADSLAGKIREAVLVGDLAGANVLIVHHVFRPDDAVQILEVGAAIPWHACALGKAIVAHTDDRRREQLLAGDLAVLTGRTITSRARLSQELARVQRDGYAIENSEATVGDAGIAAPVFDKAGAVVGAIGTMGPVERLLAKDHRRDGVAAVRDAARNLSRELGAARTPAAGARLR
jgi:DNA-binding IclR family transcriptional regulator